jgi:hypothetical protein
MNWKCLAGASLLAAGLLACQPRQKDPRKEADQEAEAERDRHQATEGQVQVADGDAQSAYRGEVDAICNAEVRSGASERPEGERSLVVAMWLGDNVKTADGRRLLAEVARLAPPDKVVLLDREAAAAGLPDCAMARTWNGGATPAQIPPAAAPPSAAPASSPSGSPGR